MDSHIEISLEWQNKQVDLAVPADVTAHRLIELLSQAFKTNNKHLPAHWHFIIKGKSVALENGLTLRQLGLSNGEILQLIEGEENEVL